MKTIGQIFAATAKRFDFTRDERRCLSMNEGAQRVAQYMLEEVQIGDPAPRELILDEGQTGEVILRNKDGHTSKFKIEAGSHRLWISER